MWWFPQGVGSKSYLYEFTELNFLSVGFQLTPKTLNENAVRQLCASFQAADRRYVLLYLWMAREGGGMVPSKPIMGSARRLRVT